MADMADLFSQPTDQQALALTHAIALQESGQGGKPNYNAVGDNGTSHGAYQWQPGNYESAAKEAGLDPNDHSPQTQDKVAYYQVKKYKDQGLDPGQIASIWNSGSPDNWKDHKGTTIINGKPISYDTPAYVQGVKQHYQQLVGSQVGYQTQPSLPQETPEEQAAAQKAQAEGPTLPQELQGRAQDISAGAGQIAQGTFGGILQGGLQVAGGVAGGIGDVTTKTLELIPGVKLGEHVIGSALGAVMGAPGIKDVVAGVNQLAQEHPQLAKDVGAVINIASVIPLFKGVGLAADAVKTTAAKALQGQLETAAKKEIIRVADQSIAGRTLMEKSAARGLDPIGAVTKEGIPDVYTDSGGTARYNGTEGFMNLSRSLNQDEAKLQDVLERASPAGSLMLSNKANLEQLRQEALKEVEADFKATGSSQLARTKVNKIFDDYKSQYGDFIPLKDLNDMKRGVRAKVNWKTPQLSSDVRYTIGQTFMNEIERIADKQGLPEVSQINKEMASKLEAQKLLKLMHKKQVKLTSGEKAVRGLGADVAGGIGEFVGGMTGIPFAGTLAGRAAGRGLLNREPGTIFRNLQRARNAGSATKKAGKALRGIATPTVLRTVGQAQEPQ